MIKSTPPIGIVLTRILLIFEKMSSFEETDLSRRRLRDLKMYEYFMIINVNINF